MKVNQLKVSLLMSEAIEEPLLAIFIQLLITTAAVMFSSPMPAWIRLKNKACKIKLSPPKYMVSVSMKTYKICQMGISDHSLQS